MNAYLNKSKEELFRDYLLFSLPSTSSGIAKLIDLGSTFNDYNITFEPNQDDYNAILSDWLIVGKDIIYSMKNLKPTITLKNL